MDISKYFQVSDDFILYFDICEENSEKVFLKIYAPTHNLAMHVVAVLYAGFRFIDQKGKHTWEYKEGFHDASVELFNKRDNSLDLGLVTRAVNFIRDSFKDAKIRLSPRLTAIFKKPGGDVTIEALSDFIKYLNPHHLSKNTVINPYDHQKQLFLRGVNGRRISMVACTGSGKSFAQYMMCRWFYEREKKKVLLIVPSSGLVEQMFRDFNLEYGWVEAKKHCTLIYADSSDALSKSDKEMLSKLNLGEETMLKDVVISTWQSLLRKPESFFNVFGAVIVDEAHGAKADELRRILGQCKNAEWRMGLSGTIPDSGLDAALIEGALGRREEIIKSAPLIEMGILSPVEIHALLMDYDMGVRPFICRAVYQDQFNMATCNGSRKQVMDILLRIGKITVEENTLILFKRKESIDEMKEFISQNFPQFNILIIKGEVKALVRDQYRDVMENSAGNILLATYGTMKQGVNIRRLHNLVFAEFSKSMYEVVQSIGRILRLHNTKPLARVFDIVDDASYITKKGMGRPTFNYGISHYNERLKYYHEEKFPVIEFRLPFVATIDTVALDKKKKDAASRTQALKDKKKKSPKKIIPKSGFKV